MDDHQFKEKVLPLSKSLFSLCVRILGDRDEAKDALQDVFVKLLTSKESILEIRNFEAFIKTVTRNHCLDIVKLKKKKVPIDNVQVLDESDDQKSIIQDQTFKLKLINVALKELNPVQQKVFVMRDIERMSFTEISNLMGLTEENIRVTLSRSRKRIREILSDSISKNKVYEH